MQSDAIRPGLYVGFSLKRILQAAHSMNPMDLVFRRIEHGYVQDLQVKGFD